MILKESDVLWVEFHIEMVNKKNDRKIFHCTLVPTFSFFRNTATYDGNLDFGGLAPLYISVRYNQ